MMSEQERRYMIGIVAYNHSRDHGGPTRVWYNILCFYSDITP